MTIPDLKAKLCDVFLQQEQVQAQRAQCDAAYNQLAQDGFRLRLELEAAMKAEAEAAKVNERIEGNGDLKEATA